MNNNLSANFVIVLILYIIPVNTWRLKDVVFWSRRHITNSKRHSHVKMKRLINVCFLTSIIRCCFVDLVLHRNTTVFQRWLISRSRVISLRRCVALCLMKYFTRIIIINIFCHWYSLSPILDKFHLIFDIFFQISLPLPPLPVEKIELLFTSVQSENLKESEIKSFGSKNKVCTS